MNREKIFDAVLTAAILAIGAVLFQFQQRISRLEALMESRSIAQVAQVQPAPTATQPPTVDRGSNVPADTECMKREMGATVDGQPVPMSSWQNDCAYAQPGRIWGKRVVLTTWGLVMQHAGSAVVRTWLVAPHTSFILVDHSSLFAGYFSNAGALTAYRNSVPTGPKPDLIQ